MWNNASAREGDLSFALILGIVAVIILIAPIPIFSEVIKPLFTGLILIVESIFQDGINKHRLVIFIGDAPPG